MEGLSKCCGLGLGSSLNGTTFRAGDGTEGAETGKILSSRNVRLVKGVVSNEEAPGLLGGWRGLLKPGLGELVAFEDDASLGPGRGGGTNAGGSMGRRTVGFGRVGVFIASFALLSNNAGSMRWPSEIGLRTTSRPA